MPGDWHYEDFQDPDYNRGRPGDNDLIGGGIDLTSIDPNDRLVSVDNLVLAQILGRMANRPPNVTLPDINTPEGVLARVLIAESLNPGYGRRYNEADTLKAMQMMKAVYKNRLKDPGRYMAPGAETLTDVIVARGQTAGFSKDADGNVVISPDVQRRIDEVVARANAGSPGAYARLVQNAINVANGTTPSLDPFANQGGVVGYRTAGSRPPGGDLVAIPASAGGVVGGQQFYRLRNPGGGGGG